ncbi:MAG: four helix bundle protein [Bacteroidetes bacterium]|nr:MAG: four helix bundle protein [Bacteroidota bacterium]
MENEQERSTTFFRFEDLRIYHKSLDYINWLYSLASKIQDEPLVKTFYDRFLSSAQGIALNIAEGSSRNKSQFVYYLKMAKSSVRECVVLSTIGQQRAYINDDDYDQSKNQLMEMTKMIGALIGSLQRSVKTTEGEEEEELG